MILQEQKKTSTNEIKLIPKKSPRVPPEKNEQTKIKKTLVFFLCNFIFSIDASFVFFQIVLYKYLLGALGLRVKTGNFRPKGCTFEPRQYCMGWNISEATSYYIEQ
jgi:hypothetical protein